MEFLKVDFGLWTPDQKQVTKEKVPSRILSASWSADGSLLALGMLSGVISIRNQQAQEVQKIERKAPVWCLQFIPDTSGYGAGGGNLKATSLLSIQQQQQGGQAAGGASNAAASGTENSDLLAVGCWDKTYSLYRLGLGRIPPTTSRWVILARQGARGVAQAADGEAVGLLPVQHVVLGQHALEDQLLGD